MPAHAVRQAWLSGLIANDEYGQWVERRTFAKRAERRLERTYYVGRRDLDVAAIDRQTNAAMAAHKRSII